MVATLETANGVTTTTGFVDAHSHLRSTSLVDHGVVAHSLEEAILRMTAMTPVDATDDAYVACCDLLTSGVTAVQLIFHTFGGPEEYLAQLDAVVEGIVRSGIRALVILGATDQAEFVPPGVDYPDGFPQWATPSRRMTPEDFAKSVHEARRTISGVELGVGPVGPQWCSDEMLEAIGGLAAGGVRVHTHFLESRLQRQWIAENPLDRLERFGLLGPHTSLAHGVWVNSDELARIADTGAHLVTCPQSNRQLGAGKADYEAWQESGVSTALGLDSIDPASIPWKVARSIFSPERALEVLTTGGVAATGLNASDDRVVWLDHDNGVVEQLVVAGHTRIVDGTLVDVEQVDEARARLNRAVNADRLERQSRQAQIDSCLFDYLQALERR